MSKAHEIVRNGMPLAGLFRRFPDGAAAEAQFKDLQRPSAVFFLSEPPDAADLPTSPEPGTGGYR